MTRWVRYAREVAVLAAFLVAAVPGPTAAQILNTLRGFDRDAAGWSGEIGAFFSATGGNTDKASLSGSGAVQWQGSVSRWRLLADGTRAESDGETDEEASSIHLRHNARLSDRFATLAFLQHQYDRFQRLDSRFLLGAGLRWDVLREGRLQAALGASPMLEVEREKGHDALARGRLSTFVTVLGRLDERTSVDLTAFVQPAMDELADTRAVGIGSLRVVIAGGVSLLVDGRVQYDARPAREVDETDWKLKTGLSLSL